MEIKDVKVWFSQFGISTPILPKRKVCYIPMAKITYTDKKIKAKQISLLDSGVIGDFGCCTLTKKNYMGTLYDTTYFCVISTAKILVFDIEGNFKKSLNTKETGLIISAADDTFYCLKNGKILSAYNPEGSLLWKREFRSEEFIKHADAVNASIMFENNVKIFYNDDK